ncbi:WD40/YVTN/BNR-like repeat-containing protein [Massilia niastensis]|uniref:WD40/YVTN/BNR-like repeat-containing protein n=1 Tax=Massilia niastensis TaxID=544911 RepID=UPI0004780E93|nr:YCF48-related protein [Massilia niastensis]
MRTPVGVAVASVVIMAALWSFSPREAQSIPTIPDMVDRMQLNSIARSGAGLVAGGELGYLMLSRDQGLTWQPAVLPAQRQALITQVAFADAATGIAVGHEGWILRTTDGGRSWQEQAFDRKDGEPLMSVARLPSGRWMAVGAFGRALASDDDGKSWRRLALAAVEDRHLNRIAASGDGRHWLIVGERGLVLRSGDGGESWETVTPFYAGSFYGAVHLGKSTWVVHGMRGNVFRSTDDGRSWVKSTLPAPVSLLAHGLGTDGRLLLAGQGGMVVASDDDGASFKVVQAGGRATLTDMTQLRSGDWLFASDRGLKRDISIAPTPSTSAAAAQPNQGPSQ